MVLAISGKLLGILDLPSLTPAHLAHEPRAKPELRSLLRMRPKTDKQRAAYMRRLVDEAQKNGARDLIYDDDQPND